MSSGILDIEISWTEPFGSSIFEQCGKKIKINAPQDTYCNYNLNLDIICYFKKSTLTQLVDYICEDLLDTQIPYLRLTRNMISCVILLALSPKTNGYITSTTNEYRKLFEKFKKYQAEWRISKADVQELHLSSEIIKRLLRENLLEEEDDFYYVKGHILKNLKINPI